MQTTPHFLVMPRLGSYGALASRIRVQAWAHARSLGPPRFVIVGDAFEQRPDSPTALAQLLTVLHEFGARGEPPLLLLQRRPEGSSLSGRFMATVGAHALRLGYQLRAHDPRADAALLQRAIQGASLAIVHADRQHVPHLHAALSSLGTTLAVALIDDDPALAGEGPSARVRQLLEIPRLVAIRPAPMLEDEPLDAAGFVAAMLAPALAPRAVASQGDAPSVRAVNRDIQRLPCVRTPAEIARAVGVHISAHLERRGLPNLVIVGDRKNDAPDSPSSLAQILAVLEEFASLPGAKTLMLQRAPQVVESLGRSLRPRVPGGVRSIAQTCAMRSHGRIGMPRGLAPFEAVAWHAMGLGYALRGYDPRGPAGPVDRDGAAPREVVMRDHIAHAMRDTSLTVVVADWCHVPALRDMLSPAACEPMVIATVDELNDGHPHAGHLAERMRRLLATPGALKTRPTTGLEAQPLDAAVFIEGRHASHFRAGLPSHAHPGSTAIPVCGEEVPMT